MQLRIFPYLSEQAADGKPLSLQATSGIAHPAVVGILLVEHIVAAPFQMVYPGLDRGLENV